MAPRRLATLLPAGLLLGLLTAACGGDPPTPPPLTITPAPTTTAPTQAPESAEDFIRRWVEVSDEMQRDGDTGPFRALTRGCTACDTFADTVDRVYKAGGQINFGGTRILSISRRAGLAYDYYVDAQPTVYRESAHGPQKKLPGGKTKLGVDLIKTADGWLVTDSYRRPTVAP